jgi:hypothetical protein
MDAIGPTNTDVKAWEQLEEKVGYISFFGHFLDNILAGFPRTKFKLPLFKPVARMGNMNVKEVTGGKNNATEDEKAKNNVTGDDNHASEDEKAQENVTGDENQAVEDEKPKKKDDDEINLTFKDNDFDVELIFKDLFAAKEKPAADEKAAAADQKAAAEKKGKSALAKLAALKNMAGLKNPAGQECAAKKSTTEKDDAKKAVAQKSITEKFNTEEKAGAENVIPQDKSDALLENAAEEEVQEGQFLTCPYLRLSSVPYWEFLRLHV